jgi:F-type H+-transporting ATPase subunit gamma
MASAKDLKKKIRSIANTKKITRTMELVATAKSKRAQDRVHATTPYSAALGEIMSAISRSGNIRHPLLETPSTKAPTAVLVISANRGLCGGYNTNVLALAERTIRSLEAEAGKVDIYMAGRKGIGRFRFLRIPVVQSFLNLDDRAAFNDVEVVAQGLLGRFLKGELARVLVVYTHYFSAGSQRPVVAQLLPIVPPAAGEGAARTAESPAAGGGREAGGGEDTILEPDPATILEALLPLSVKSALYRMVLEAATSEQIARRLAMKIATDNAEEMIRHYTRFYNRTRQASITQQINEIVSGANALD